MHVIVKSDVVLTIFIDSAYINLIVKSDVILATFVDFANIIDVG